MKVANKKANDLSCYTSHNGSCTWSILHKLQNRASRIQVQTLIDRILIVVLEIKMHFYMSYQYLAPALVAITSLLSFIQSLQSNPASAIKDILVVLSLLLVDVFDNVGWLRAFGVLIPLCLLVVVGIVFSWASAVAY